MACGYAGEREGGEGVKVFGNEAGESPRSPTSVVHEPTCSVNFPRLASGTGWSLASHLLLSTAASTTAPTRAPGKADAT